MNQAAPLDDASPYAGLRVLDVSQGIAGPYCALMLAQMGASIIKVEPAEGDWGRTMGLAPQGFSAIALAFNAGKRSISVDARTPGGRAVLLDLAAGCDVLVQSFRPGVAQRLGIGYEALCALHPALVYVSISGFGLDGPYVDRPGTDSVLQALSGLMTLNADAHGSPRRIQPFMGDLACGMYAANAVGAALYGRSRSGRGRHLDVSLLATMAALQNSPLIDERLRAGAPPTAVTYPQGVFPTLDGHILVFAMNNAMFRSVCRVIGRNEWLDDPRMQTAQARILAGEEINRGVAEVLCTRPTQAWVQAFRANDILYGEVKDYEAFLADEQVRHQGVFGNLEQPGLGRLPFAGLPGAPAATAAVAAVPRIGEHTVAVLRELGYTTERIAALIGDGTVAQAVEQDFPSEGAQAA